MTSPLISTIIVAYKSEDCINNCISSVLKSAKFAKITLEIIVVINDIENNKYHLSACRIIKSKVNLGFAKACNLGSKIAKAEWLLFVNPDTVTYKQTLKELFKYTNNKKFSLMGPKILNTNGSLQPNILAEPTLWNLFIEQSYLYKIFPNFFHHPQSDMSWYKKSGEVLALSGAYMLVRKTVFQKVGGFDERFFMYFEDINLCNKSNTLNFRILYVSTAKILHYNHSSNRGVLNGVFYSNSLIKYLTKHNNKLFTISVIIIYIFGCIIRKIYWTFKFKIVKNMTKRKFIREKIRLYNNIIYNLLNHFQTIR